MGINPASGMPGYPSGPMLCSTKTDEGVTSSSGESMRCARSAALQNTTAGPECDSRARSLEAEAFIIVMAER